MCGTRQPRRSSALAAALLALPVFLLLSAAAPEGPFHEGDRTFTRGAATLRQLPDEKSAAVAPLLPGDEVAVQEPEENPFKDPPADWVRVATTEVASHRIYQGWLRIAELTPDPPADAARAALLRRTVEQDLSQLEAREAAFGALKDQAMHWRTVPNGERQAQELATKLAKYMEAEITPRALDAIDRLDQLRPLDDLHAPALGKRLEELAKAFQP